MVTKRLIDANAIIKDIDNYYHNSPFSHPGTTWLRGLELAVGLLLKAPTVDVRQVVHGRWEDQYDGKYANPRYRCSVCKEKALYKFERDSLCNHRAVQALTTICPYCSAKLDGGNDNDI